VILVAYVLSLAAAVAVVWFYLSRQQDRLRRRVMDQEMYFRDRYLHLQLLGEREKETADRIKSVPGQRTLAQVVEEKKKKLQDITSISFHFVDKGEVTNFYNDTFKEPTVESLVTEIATQVGAEAKAGLPQLLETKLGGKDLSKWISTVKLPDTSLPGMFVRYQREAIKRGEVLLGLEELDIELNELQQFQTAVSNLQGSFGLTLDQSLVESHTTKLKEKAAETMVGKLENATGWVLIEGKFRIDKTDGMYSCVYNHPVSDYFSKGATPVTISFTIAASSIEERYTGNYAQSVGRLIPLRVYGKVWQPINRSTCTWDLEITPLAIY
jgi:hypothetical protein